jgi:hypothetical protein
MSGYSPVAIRCAGVLLNRRKKWPVQPPDPAQKQSAVIQIGFQYRLGNERRSYRTRSGQSPWWIEWKFLPLDHQNRKYIAVYLDNPSDYIIRGATVSAQIKLKSAGDDAAITVPSAPCVGPHSEFRVLARTATDGQTCIVTLSAEHSKLVPERDFDASSKTVDLDALELRWWFTSVAGHSQPIKVLRDFADWLGIDKLKAQFARVNR